MATSPVQGQSGQFLTCNGCSIPAMRSAAVGQGAGEHLVIDVTGRKGLIVSVSCGPYIDRPDLPPTDRDSAKSAGSTTDSSHICWINATRWSSDDQLAFDLIIDGMTSSGSWAKALTVNKPSTSIYDLAANPDASFMPIRNTLWSNVYTYGPGGAAWGTLISWGANFFGLASDAKLVITIQFKDGSIMAEIDMSWAAQNFDGPSLAHVTIRYDTAIDADGNPVPNLSMPAQINPPGVQFNFWRSGAEPPEWRDLMTNLGYGFGSQATGGSVAGTMWRCGVASGHGTAGYSCERVH